MESKKDVFANSEDKWDFIIAIIVIVFFSVFIFQFFFKTEEKIIVDATTQLNKSQIEPIAIVSKKEEEDQYIYTNPNKYQTKTIKVEDAYQSEIDSAVIITNVIKSKPVVIDAISKSINTDNKTVVSSDAQIKSDATSITSALSNSQIEPGAKIEVKDTIITTQEPIVQVATEKKLPKTTSAQLEQETKVQLAKHLTV